MSSSSEDDAYGPPLPPHLKSKQKQENENSPVSSGDEDAYGSSLPPQLLLSLAQRRNISSDDARVTSLSSDLLRERREKDDSNGDLSDSEAYGPTLPLRIQTNKREKKEEESDSDEDAYLPPLPPNLEKHSQKRRDDSEVHQNKLLKRDTEKEESEDDDDDDDIDIYVPALPPHLMKNKKQGSSVSNVKRIQGPSLPVGFIPPEPSSCIVDEDDDCEESEDEQVIGPTPSAVAFNEEEHRIQQIELRAKRMKDKLEGKYDESKPVQRETWMLELPEDKPNFCGLAPRQFRKKAPQEKGDRSIWTDTPEDKERKAQMDPEIVEQQRDPESVIIQQRNEDLKAKVDKYNKDKRATALIDLHQEKMKKKKESSGPKERRPFSREEDMNVNKFDEAQKNTILKKARQLDDRFSAGNKNFL